MCHWKIFQHTMHSHLTIYIKTHLKREKKNAMVVLGSYGRTKLSRWFKSSFVEAIVNEFSIPIFLTHH
jgi:nucleotide-binding universal stress UspA family protein